jgi:hypothetical protein
LKRTDGSGRLKAEQLEKALNPKQPFEDLLEKARLILPQIVDNTKASDQGRINVAEMRRLLKIPHNTAYNIRKELLKELQQKETLKSALFCICSFSVGQNLRLGNAYTKRRNGGLI